MKKKYVVQYEVEFYDTLSINDTVEIIADSENDAMIQFDNDENLINAILKHNPDSKPFETVPQLFSVHNDDFQEGCSECIDIVYLGGYADNWKNLSPLF
jgi:hypothetical protein